ncbi:hypothetical protein A2U01_0027192, partial [Trifolium medium]|nr:hypothetical protein [Trifolium medium]
SCASSVASPPPYSRSSASVLSRALRFSRFRDLEFLGFFSFKLSIVRLFEWNVLLRWKNGSMMKKGHGGGER